MSLEILRGLVRRAATESATDPLSAEGQRILVWRLLLGVFDTRPDGWVLQAAQQRKAYTAHATECLGEEVLAAPGDGGLPEGRAAELLEPRILEIWEAVCTTLQVSSFFLQAAPHHICPRLIAM